MTARKNDGSEGSKDISRNYFLTSLALELFRESGQLIYTGHSGADGLESFHAAVRSAEQLLKAVDDRKKERIHAYRLFPVSAEGYGEMLNPKQIADRFEEVGWGKGMGVGTIRSLISEILKSIQTEIDQRRDGYLEFVERRGSQEPAYSDIEGLVKAVLEDFAVPGLIGDVGHLSSRIAGVFRRMIDDATRPILREFRVKSESPTDPLTTAYFMEFLCGYDSFAERQNASDSQVRPYELFLFAFQNNLSKDKLEKPRSELCPDFIPEPEYKSSLSILVNHGGASQALEEWDRQDQERQKMREELEKKTDKELLIGRLKKNRSRNSAQKSAAKKMTTKKAARNKRTAKKSPKKKPGKS